MKPRANSFFVVQVNAVPGEDAELNRANYKNSMDATIQFAYRDACETWKNGQPPMIGTGDTHGATLRHCRLSSRGELLAMGNQGSANMSVFKLNRRAGSLTYLAATGPRSVPFFARMVER